MVGQQGFWDDQKRLNKLREKKTTLEHLNATIPWQEFRPLLESVFEKDRKSPAGRKRIRRDHHVQNVVVATTVRLD